MLKFISWNVNGLRSIYRKGFEGFLEREKPDVLCLQEIKIDSEALAELVADLPAYTIFASPAQRKGYSGVATLLRDETIGRPIKVSHGIGIEEFDSEGRFVISEHSEFLLYNMYIPSGTTGQLRQDFKYKFLDSLSEHIASLPKAKKKKLILCGDFNICHKAIDIHHPKVATKKELSGFLPAERKWMDDFVDLGFSDTLRVMHPDEPKQYSWWSFRAGSRGKNLGWRIDYFFIASELEKKLSGARIEPEIMGSDHCPIFLDMNF